MRNVKKVTILLVAAIVLTITMATEVFAATSTKPKFINKKVTVLSCENHSWSDEIINRTENAKIISVKSSNENVVRTSLYEDKKNFSWSGLQPGKAVITAKVKQNGKTYTIKRTIVVKNDKPFVYIKYGNKNIYKGNEYRSNFQYGMKNNQKITWKLKPGYKIVKVTSRLENSTQVQQEIKNGAKLKTTNKGFHWVTFDVKLKSGEVVQYRILLKKSKSQY